MNLQKSTSLIDNLNYLNDRYFVLELTNGQLPLPDQEGVPEPPKLHHTVDTGPWCTRSIQADDVKPSKGQP